MMGLRHLSGDRSEIAAAASKYRMMCFVGSTCGSVFFLAVVSLVPFNQYWYPFHLDAFTIPSLFSSLVFLVLIGLFAVAFDERAVASQPLSLPLLSAQSVEQVEREAVRLKRVRQAAVFLILSNSIYFGAFWLLYPNLFVLGAFYGKVIHSLPSVWMTYFPVFMGETTGLFALFLLFFFSRSLLDFEESKTLFLPSSHGVTFIGCLCLFTYNSADLTIRFILGSSSPFLLFILY
jgi:hypothetical protein